MKTNSTLFFNKYKSLKDACEILYKKQAELKEQSDVLHQEKNKAFREYQAHLIQELVSRDFKEGELYWKKKQMFKSDKEFVLIKIIGLGNFSNSMGDKSLIVARLGFNKESPTYVHGYGMEKTMISPEQIAKDYELSSKKDFNKLKRFLIKNLEDTKSESWHCRTEYR